MNKLKVALFSVLFIASHNLQAVYTTATASIPVGTYARVGIGSSKDIPARYIWYALGGAIVLVGGIWAYPYIAFACKSYDTRNREVKKMLKDSQLYYGNAINILEGSEAKAIIIADIKEIILGKSTSVHPFIDYMGKLSHDIYWLEKYGNGLGAYRDTSAGVLGYTQRLKQLREFISAHFYELRQEKQMILMQAAMQNQQQIYIHTR